MRERTCPGSGKKIDGADLSRADVQNPLTAVPHAHAIIEVVDGGIIGDEYGPALERQPHVTAERLDASDVAKARHEGPAEIELAAADFDAEILIGSLPSRSGGT